MKTAEEVLKENFDSEDWTSGFRDDIISCMKQYATDVAKKALEDAFQNAECGVDGWSGPYVEEKSITETEIITP